MLIIQIKNDPYLCSHNRQIVIFTSTQFVVVTLELLPE